MKTKNRLLALLAIIAFAIGLSASNALADTYRAQANGSWSTLATWLDVTTGLTATTLPSASDNVIIPAPYTVIVNQATIEINDLHIGDAGTGTAVLQPDASSSRQITIDGNLTVGNGLGTGFGKILLDDQTGTGSGTGRLSWTFIGAAGTSSLTLQNGNGALTAAQELTYAAYVKFFNVSVTGATALNNGATNYSGFYVYGNFTTTLANFSVSGTSNTNQTIYLNGTTKAITNNGGNLTFYSLNIPSGATVSATAEFTVQKDLTVAGTFTQSSPSIITMTGVDATSNTITNTGTFTIASGAELVVNSATNPVTLASNLTGVAGTFTVKANALFTVAAGKSISGAGDFALNSGATLTCGYSTGVNGVINLTGSRSFNSAANYVLSSGVTGFTSAGITTVNNLTITGTVTTAESFTVAGNLSVSGTNSFIASAGTVTLSGTGSTITSLTAGPATLILKNLAVSATATGATQAAASTMTITGDITVAALGSFTAGNLTTSVVNLTGTTTITNAGTLTPGAWTISGSGAVTLGSAFAIGGGSLTLNGANASLNASTYTITAGGASPVLTAGTFITSNAGGVSASLPAAATYVAGAVNFTFNGSPTTLGFGLTAPITSILNLTINGGAVTTVASGGAVTVNGNISVTGTASFTSDVLINMTNTGIATPANTKTITKASGATLVFGLGLAVTTGSAVTSTSDFTVSGAALSTVGTGTFTASSPSTIKLAWAGATPSAVGAIVLNNLWTTVAIAPVTAFTIAGDWLNSGAVAAGELSNITFTGTNNGIYSTGGSLSLRAITVSATANITATASGVTATVCGQSVTTSQASSITFADPTTVGYNVTINGTFTNGTGTLVTFVDATSADGFETTLTGTGTISFYDLTGPATDVLGLVISSSLNVNLAHNMNTGILINHTGSGAFTITGTTGVITGTAWKPNSFVVPANMAVTVSVAMSATNTPNLNISGTLTTGVANVITGGTLAINSGASIVTTLAGGPAAVFTAGGATTAVVSAGANYTIGAAGAIGIGSADVFTNFTITGTGGNGATAITKVNNLTIANGIDATSTDNLSIDGSLIISNATASFGATAGTITFTGTTGVISPFVSKAPVGNGVTTAGVQFNNVTFGGTTTQSGNLTFTVIGILTVNASSSFIPGTGTVEFVTSGAGSIVNNGTLTFNNLQVGDATSANVDLTAVATSFSIAGNLTIGAATSSLVASSGTITLSGTGIITPAVNFVAGAGIQFNNLAVSGTYTQAGNTIDIAGTTNALNVTGSFIPGAGAINFSQAGVITNTGTLSFNNISASATGDITTASDFSIAGNITLAVGGSLQASAGTITLSGSTAIIAAQGYAAGTAGLKFNNLAVTGSLTSLDANVVEMFGNLNVTGSIDLSASANTIAFDGVSTKSISNSGTLKFYHLLVSNLAGNNITTSSNFNIAGDIQVGAGGYLGGTLVASSGTITFNGVAVAQNIKNYGGATALKFYNIDYTGTTGPLKIGVASQEIYVLGNITNSSAANINFAQLATTKVWMAGSAEQTITKGSTGLVEFAYLTVNNSGAGVKIASFTSPSDFTVDNTLKIQKGYVDLNGVNIITLKAGDNSTGFLQEVPGNMVRNSGSTDGYITKSFTTGGSLTNANIGGLGAQFSAAIDPVTVTVKRYHVARTVAGDAGITRYFAVTFANAGGSTNFTLKYDTTELNGINESNLSLISSSSPTTGWTKRTATLDPVNHFLRGTFAGTNSTDFNSTSTSYWTASAPSQVAISKLAKGVGSLRFTDGRIDGVAITTDTLTASTTNKALAGFKVSTTNTASLSAVTVALNRSVNDGTEFTNLYLYSSTDDDFATTDDNTLLGTVSVVTGNSFTFSNLAQTISAGGAKNYFVSADLGTVTMATAPVYATISSTNITLDGSVAVQNTFNGPTFRFQPGIVITKLNGVAENPLVAGETNQAIFGFAAHGTTAADLTTFTLSFDQDSTTVANTFSNWRLYRSTSIDFDYTATARNTNLVSGTLSSAGVLFNITSTAEALLTSDKYYFVIADVKGGVDATNSSITPSLALSSIHDYNLITLATIDESAGPVSYSSLAGNTYSFANSELVVSTPNQIAAGNISKGLPNQRLFAFTLSSLYSNSIVATACSVKVDLTSAEATSLTSWKLWVDANGNSFPDNGESYFTGTYSNGYVVFPMTTSTTQTITSSKNYLVTANVALSATADGTVTVSIPDQSYVGVTGPAFVQNGGAWTGNTMTIKAPGTPTKVVLSPQYVTSVATGSTIAFTYQLQDVNSSPTNATSAVGLTIASSGGTTLGTTSGSIAIGSDFTTISPTMTNVAGTTSEVIACTNAGGYSDPATTTSITVFPAEATIAVTAAPLAVSTNTSLPGTALDVVYTAANVSPNANILIVMRAGALPVAPTDGSTYTGLNGQDIGLAGSGSTTGDGSFVVYSGAGTTNQSFSVYGLTPGTTYYFTTYEFLSSSTGLENYTTTLNAYNPVIGSTSSTGDFATHGDAGTAATIQTDLDVNGSIATSGEAAWYKFYVNSSRGNLFIHLSDVASTVNLKVELWNSAGTTLIRSAQSAISQNQTILINDVAAGTYLIKVSGYDSTQYSSTYKLRVNSRVNANDFFSQPSR